jgi:hypothetical protein
MTKQMYLISFLSNLYANRVPPPFHQPVRCLDRPPIRVLEVPQAIDLDLRLDLLGVVTSTSKLIDESRFSTALQAPRDLGWQCSTRVRPINVIT